MVLRQILDRRYDRHRDAAVHELTVRPLASVLIGVVGGLVVGITSVGSGSLMIVLLLFLYPEIGAKQLVGTDLTQAVPLTCAAALGAVSFGHVELSVTSSLVVGGVPGVLAGSLVSSRAPDRYVRPVITFVILASGLKYVGVGTTELGWALCGVLLAGGLVWLGRSASGSPNRPCLSRASRSASPARRFENLNNLVKPPVGSGYSGPATSETTSGRALGACRTGLTDCVPQSSVCPWLLPGRPTMRRPPINAVVRTDVPTAISEQLDRPSVVERAGGAVDRRIRTGAAGKSWGPLSGVALDLGTSGSLSLRPRNRHGRSNCPGALPRIEGTRPVSEVPQRRSAHANPISPRGRRTERTWTCAVSISRRGLWSNPAAAPPTSHTRPRLVRRS